MGGTASALAKAMNLDDEILEILSASPDMPFSAKHIGRMLDRQQFRENPNWARPHLEMMVFQRRIQCDSNGYWFQAKTEQKREPAFA